MDPENLYARTRGNPFFVTEILAAGGEIPATVRDAVLARAGRLGRGAWTVLEAAAVIGTPIEFDLLGQVADLDSADLHACLDNGMLRDDGRALAFRHELAREAILTAISPNRRASLNARVLQALEAAPAASSSPGAARPPRRGGWGSGPRCCVTLRRQRNGRPASGHTGKQPISTIGPFASPDGLAPEERARLLEARAYECYLTAQMDLAVASREAALTDLVADRGSAKRRRKPMSSGPPPLV